MGSLARSRVAPRAVLCLLLVAGSACRRDTASHTASAETLLAGLGRLHLPRRIAPRLSIPVAYRTCTLVASDDRLLSASRCGSRADGETPPAAALDIAARASHLLRDTLDVDALRATALADLLWTDSAGISLTRSISSLRIAARLASDSTAVLGDLAAAYLERAVRTQNPRDLFEAVDVAARVLDAAPRNAPARFNLALALDYLGFDEQAMHAWQAYLDVDAVSPWAAEARAHLGARRTARSTRYASVREVPDTALAAFVAAHPQEGRVWAWDHGLGAWGQAMRQGDSATARALLHRAAIIGATLERRGGDATTAEAVRAIRDRQHDLAAMRSLALAHSSYAMGRAAYAAADYATARRHFEHALALSAASQPLRQWTTLFLAATFVYLSQRPHAEQLLRPVVDAADTAHDPALAARAQWSLGISVLRDGHHAAIRRIRAARALFARSGERENLGAVEYIEGEADIVIGQAAAGYTELYRTLMTLRPYRSSVWLHNVLWTLAGSLANEGLVHAAIITQDEDVAVAERTGRPIDAVEAKLARARLRAHASATTGDTVAAARDIAAARSVIAQLPAGAARRWFEADLRRSEVTDMRRDPARAAAALDSAIAFYGQANNRVDLLAAILERAHAMLVLGNVPGATSNLDSAAALLDSWDTDLAAAPLQASLLDRSHAVFDELAMLRLAGGRPTEALEDVERGRVSLTSQPSAAGDPGVDDMSGPPGETVVDYALVGDTLLVWTIGGHDVHFVRRTIPRTRLERIVDRTRAALEMRSGEATLRGDLISLYDQLVRPMAGHLGPRDAPLVIVADGEIAGVPFAALYDSARHSYLVETHPIRFASSLRDAAREEPSTTTGSSALFVADPAFDERAFPAFGPLPGAAAEVQELAASYAHPVVLTGHAASRARVEQALRRATVFHYAGHAVFDDAQPGASFLALAATDTDVGELAATDVARLDLRQLRLVVLSACETMHADHGRSGGFAGLAGAFLAAGAHGVVGSLWRVDDALTRALMVGFHRAYRTSGDGAAALRAAQLGFLHSPDPSRRSPAAWASFRYAGR